MSNNRRHRRALGSSKRERERRANLEAAFLATKLLTGCTCAPELRHRHADGTRVLVGHDDWCPAVDHGTQWVIRLRRTK
jgi:hypothetical protein